jgi:squalene synthase HpnC
MTVRTPEPAAVLAKAGRENFPVASSLFPREVRPHLMAVYGFARLADDIGDEVDGDRLAMLDRLEAEVDLLHTGMPADPMVRRLVPTVRAFDIPSDPFRRLIEANRRDQVTHRYETFDALLGYCALSANPVGELVLRILGAWTPGRAEWSDATCTALQLVEFWQDLGEDARRGRVYLPLRDIEGFGYSVEELFENRANDRFRALMAFEADRTRSLFDQGRPLAGTLPGRAGFAVRLFTAGGVAALEDLERRGFDTLSSNGHPSAPRRAWAAARELIRR